MEVMFVIMGCSAAILVALAIFAMSALELEPFDKTFPTGQTLNGGVE